LPFSISFFSVSNTFEEIGLDEKREEVFQSLATLFAPSPSRCWKAGGERRWLSAGGCCRPLVRKGEGMLSELGTYSELDRCLIIVH